MRLREAERQAERQTALAGAASCRRPTSTPRSPTATRRGPRSPQLEAELAVAAPAGARAGGRRRREPARGRRGGGARRRAGSSSKRDLAAPVAGEVTDVFRRTGEIAGPTEPVVSILPDGAFKLVVFVGETGVRRRSRPATVLAVRCDGCPDGLTATVSYVSDEPEFTPPVIYSVENRQKLVYRVEARPADGRAAACGPGRSSMSRSAE